MLAQHFSAGKVLLHILCLMLNSMSKSRVKNVLTVIIITCQEAAQHGGLRVWALQLDCMGSSSGATTSWLYDAEQGA